MHNPGRKTSETQNLIGNAFNNYQQKIGSIKHVTFEKEQTKENVIPYEELLKACPIPDADHWLTISEYPAYLENEILYFFNTIGTLEDYVFKRPDNVLYVKYKSMREVYQALKLNNCEILQEKINIFIVAGAPKNVSKNTQTLDSMNAAADATLYRTTIPKVLSNTEWLTITECPKQLENEVFSFFEGIGALKNYEFDRSDSSLYVKYESREAFFKALSFNNCEILPEKICINVHTGARRDLINRKDPDYTIAKVALADARRQNPVILKEATDNLYKNPPTEWFKTSFFLIALFSIIYWLFGNDY